MLDFSTPHGWLRAGHIIPGFIGLVAFWIPVFAKKGGRAHLLFGNIFVICAWMVIITSLIACALYQIDPGGFSNLSPARQTPERLAQIRFFTAFLGALAVYTLIPLWLGMRVIDTRHQPAAIRSRATYALLAFEALTGMALLAFGIGRGVTSGWTFAEAVLIGLGITGVVVARAEAKFVANHPRSRMAWWTKHMQSMLTCGIAFHTAFLVFGLNRYIGQYLNGFWAVVPWFLPTLIGVPATHFWVQYYRRKFKDEPV